MPDIPAEPKVDLRKDGPLLVDGGGVVAGRVGHPLQACVTESARLFAGEGIRSVGGGGD